MSEQSAWQQRLRVGAVFPQTEIGTDPGQIVRFAQEIERLGFRDLAAYDHIVGGNPASRTNWALFYDHESAFHEPLTLFSFLAGQTRSLRFTSSVVILAQRQTALFAKQAANVDIFCNGRLRLGISPGYTELEFEALGIPFAERGARLDDQIRVLRRLWTEPSITERTHFHTIDDAGICPLPLQRPVPLWLGGNSAVAMKRAARVGDGWLPYVHTDTQALPESVPAGLTLDTAHETFASFRQMVAAAGRDPKAVPVEAIVFLRNMQGAHDLSAHANTLTAAGATGLFIDTMRAGLTSVDQHLDAFRDIAARLGLVPLR